MKITKQPPEKFPLIVFKFRAQMKIPKLYREKYPPSAVFKFRAQMKIPLKQSLEKYPP